jgi:hypothetical protein
MCSETGAEEPALLTTTLSAIQPANEKGRQYWAWVMARQAIQWSVVGGQTRQ